MVYIGVNGCKYGNEGEYKGYNMMGSHLAAESRGWSSHGAQCHR